MSSELSPESTVFSVAQAQECLILILEASKHNELRSALQNSHCSSPLRVLLPSQPNLDSWLILVNKFKYLVGEKKYQLIPVDLKKKK